VGHGGRTESVQVVLGFEGGARGGEEGGWGPRTRTGMGSVAPIDLCR